MSGQGTPLERVVSRLDRVMRSGAGYAARCPAHDDRDPSLSVREGEDGRVLLHCFGGCSPEAVVSALDLKMADLFPEQRDEDTPDPQSSRRIVRTYDYCDERDRLLYQVVRFDPKGFAQRRPRVASPDPKRREDWEWNLNDTSRILYRLPQLRDADPAAWVYLPEGEKDADNLAALGLIASCNAGGAGKWRAEYGESLRGRRVAILPDRDEPGRKHADDVARRLHGIAAEVRIVALPGLPEKGDVSDWLAAGGNAATLAALVDAAPRWTPESDWEPPIPFGTPSLPAFPLDALPSPFGEYADALATATQTPPDLAGLHILAAIATATAGKAIVIPHYGWSEPLNISTCGIGSSGERKSALHRAIIAPLDAWERAEIERLALDHAEQRSRRRVKEMELKKAERLAAEGKDASERNEAGERARRLARELADLPEPVDLQLIADDATPETVKTLLAEQGGRLALLSAEGTIFELMAGRYSQKGGPNLEVYLHGHAGDAIRVNRRGRRELIANPALTVGVLVQPDVLRAFADRPSFRGRGLVARFIYTLPESLVGRRAISPPPVPDSVRDAYTAALTRLLELPLPASPPPLIFDAHASRAFNAFRARIEPQLGEFGRLGDMADWGSKLPGAVARVAGLLHLARHTLMTDPWDEPIAAATMEAAIAIGEYAIPHALAAAGLMGMDGDDADSRYLLRWLAKEHRTSYPKQEIWQGTRRRFDKAEHLDRALDRLEAHRIIRAHPSEERTGPGRKPAPVYEMTPYPLPTIPTIPTIGLSNASDGNSRDSRDSRGKDRTEDDDDWGTV